MNEKLSRALPWALLLSLALNLFMGGAILSHRFAHVVHDGERHGMSQRHGALPHPRLLRRALSEPAKQRFDALHESHKPVIRERLKLVGEARHAVSAALREEPFDRMALDAAFAQLRDQETQLASEMQAMLAALAAELGPEDREALAKVIPRSRRGAHAGGREPEAAPTH